MYSLTCTVTGAEGLTDAMMTYQWRKNNAVVSGQTMATLSFSPLSSSDAGSYTCQATVASSLLSASITTTPSSSLRVQLIGIGLNNLQWPFVVPLIHKRATA
jgi:hypothetical protein